MSQPQLTTLEPWIAKKIGVSQLTLAALQAYQLQALRQTVANAQARSPFYRQHLQGVAAAGLKTLADFAELPTMEESHLRQQGKKMLCVGQEEISRIVSLDTSGTTHHPKRIYFTAQDQQLTVDFFVHGMQSLTAPGQAVWILLPASRPGSVGDLLAKGLAGFGAKPVRWGVPQDIGETVQAMAAQPADFAVANPVQMLALGHCYQYLQQTGGLAPGSIELKGILLSTDYVASALCRQLEQLFGCPVYEHYGLTEMGLGGSVSCQALAGSHPRAADLYFEVIDPQTGRLAPDGQFGELVFTTLTRQGMPFIRYRTGDWGRMLAEPCPCGSVLPRLDKVRHRLRWERPLPISHLDELVFALPQVLDYQAVYWQQQQALSLTLYVFQPLPAAGLQQLKMQVQVAAGCGVTLEGKRQLPEDICQLRKRRIEVR